MPDGRADSRTAVFGDPGSAGAGDGVHPAELHPLEIGSNPGDEAAEEAVAPVGAAGEAGLRPRPSQVELVRPGQLGDEQGSGHQQHPLTLVSPAATSASSVVAQAPAPQAPASLPGSRRPLPATSESASTV